MPSLHAETRKTPFLATKTAATPLHFIYGPIGGIGEGMSSGSVSMVCVWRPVLTRPG